MVKNKKDLLSPRRTKILKKPICSSSNNKGSANFKVIVRVRPQNGKEIETNQKNIVKIVDNVVVFDPKEEDQPFFYQGVQQSMRDLNKRVHKNLQFTFDEVFGPDSTNDDIFSSSTKPLIETLMNGYNCSVFVYGATGAGKTHTMIGHNESPGITYLTMKELFEQMEVNKSRKSFELGMTYLEVYNETVKDLLNPGELLHLREDSKIGVVVAGLTMKKICNPAELFETLKRGNANRTQHPTDANAESSRSHAVFQVYINMTDRVTGERNVAKLSMIDLAGSERGAATGCKGMRFTEGANINKSLLALGNCINSLADGARHVPYRDSKLTRLLKDSLGGNCQTIMIANVSPSWGNYEDTYNTLRYATRAKKIKTNVKKNVVKNDLTPAQYKKLIEDLTAQIDDLKRKNTDLETKLNQKIIEKPDVCSCKTVSSTSVSESPQTSKVYTNKILPEIVVESTETIKLNDNLKQLYAEKELVLRQISRIEVTEQIIALKHKFKENVESKLTALCEANETFDKIKNRLQSTVDSLQQQKSGVTHQLKELNDLKNKLDADIEIAKSNSGDTNLIRQLENEIELEYFRQKVQNENKVSDVYETEIELRDKIEEKMANMLKSYYKIICGYGYLTDSMKDEYEGLKNCIQGVRSVHWAKDDIFTNDNNERHQSAIIPILKHTVIKENSFDSSSRRSSRVRCRLYSETNLSTPERTQSPIMFNSEKKSQSCTLDETFDLQSEPATNRTFQVDNTPAASSKRFKKDTSTNYLPKVSSNVTSKFLGNSNNNRFLHNKENKILGVKSKFPTMDRTQKFALRQKNNSNNDGASRTIVKKTVRPLRTTPNPKDSKNFKAKNLGFMNDKVRFRP